MSEKNSNKLFINFTSDISFSKKNHLGGPFGILDRRRLAADQPSAYTGFR